jgi:geranylgeranylglycerol-phosphate geranylgeranyltransferase
MKRINGFVRLMRPINCVMMALAVVVGGVLGAAGFSDFAWLKVFLGAITGFMLTAASMAVNDYYDRAIDAINEPRRPIPSGLVSPKEALGFTFILSAVGFLAAFFTSFLCFAVSVAAWVILMLYVTVGKRSGLPGNFLVSACVAIPFLYGSLALLNVVSLNVLLFAGMAFLSNTGREVTKGIVDVKGDRVEGVKTLAVRYGEKAAAFAAGAFYVSAVCLTPIPLFLNLVSLWFVPFVLVTNVGLIVSAGVLLRDYSRESARKIKKFVLLWFIFGLLAYIFGTLR